MTRLPRFATLAAAPLALLALPGTALAHPGHGAGGGLAAGLLHPLTGMDHLAAMVLAGLWAGAMGARAARVLPLVLLGAMLAGFATAAMVPAALAEGLIAVTLAGLAVAAVLRWRAPLVLAAGAVALAGLGHGFAHGLEAPGGEAQAGFVVGFLVTAAALQALGLGLGLGLAAMITRLRGSLQEAR